MVMMYRTKFDTLDNVNDPLKFEEQKTKAIMYSILYYIGSPSMCTIDNYLWYPLDTAYDPLKM